VLTLDVNDLGNTGTGGSKTDRDTVTLTRVGTAALGRSAGGGSGEAGSANSAQTVASQNTTTSTDQVFAQPVIAQTALTSPQAASTFRLADLLASTNSGRSKAARSTDAIFGENS
jgi:hypothetical protein